MSGRSGTSNTCPTDNSNLDLSSDLKARMSRTDPTAPEETNSSPGSEDQGVEMPVAAGASGNPVVREKTLLKYINEPDLAGSDRNKRLMCEESLVNTLEPMTVPKAWSNLKTYVPSCFEINVVSSGTEGTPKSFIVTMEHHRYLFNCGEGTQRILYDQKFRISKIREVFITHDSWDNVGGLLGLMLSLKSSEVPVISVHGPPNCEKTADVLRFFSKTERCSISKKKLENDVYEDSAALIEYALLHSSDPNTDTSVPIHLRRDVSVAYIITPHKKARKVLLNKCVDLNIPAGPLIGVLKGGQEVTLDDGRVIKPDDVLEAEEPQAPFVVVECPTEAYLDALAAHPKLQPGLGGCNPELVIHMSPSKVIAHTKYQSWLNRFEGNVKHLVINEAGSPVSYEGLFRLQTSLNLVHKDIFPLLPLQVKWEAPVRELKTPSGIEMVQSETGMQYCIRPKTGFDFLSCLKIDNEESEKAALSQVGFREELEKLKEVLAEKQPALDASRAASFPVIVFLGTGSSSPSKARNASCILVHLSDTECMLLDVGEGTYGQIYRRYGSKTGEILSKIKAIFISHLHLDHHGGLYSVIFKRRQAMLEQGLNPKPLHIIAPRAFQDLLSSMETNIMPLGNDFEINTMTRNSSFTEGWVQDESVLLDCLNLRKFEVTPVFHRQFPFGIAITHKDGWKLVYSGDTVPCNTLVKIGKNCDILIHEATMEDELEKDAETKRHSTTSQAIKQGMNMNAKFTILTHFSQRYAKIPFISSSMPENVGIAFDNMVVRPCDLPLLPLLLPALKAVFTDSYSEMENRTKKRTQRKKLQEELYPNQSQKQRKKNKYKGKLPKKANKRKPTQTGSPSNSGDETKKKKVPTATLR